MSVLQTKLLCNNLSIIPFLKEIKRDTSGAPVIGSAKFTFTYSTKAS